jgi:CubicO group peptidase (beta-lactamase class C family)
MTKQFDCFSQPPINDTAFIKLKTTIIDLKNKHNAPAIVVAIIHNNQIVYSESVGYTDMEKKTPASIDSKFPIMSVTKTFTATMLMQLVEKGIAQLDDNVRKYVPEYKVTSAFPGSDKTTLFQLATHSSGLPRNSPADIGFTLSLDNWLLSDGDDSIRWFSTKKELLHSLQYIQLADAPFKYLHHNDRNYSNLGYSVLGIALERAAKTDYSKYLSDNVLKPLKMTSSGFLNDYGEDTSITKGYWYNSTSRTSLEVPAFKPNSAIYAGGIYSTARDLARYVSLQFENNSSNVLSEESKSMMRYFKIGWKPAYPFMLHEGSIPGYKCVVVFNAEAKIGWVALTNTTEFDFNPLNNVIAEITLPMFKNKPISDLKKYTGIYKLNGGYGSLEIFMKNDSLHSTYLKETLQEKPLIPDGANRFKVEGNGEYNIGYEFVINDKSEVKAVKMGQLVWYKQ